MKSMKVSVHMVEKVCGKWLKKPHVNKLSTCWNKFLNLLDTFPIEFLYDTFIYVFNMYPFGELNESHERP